MPGIFRCFLNAFFPSEAKWVFLWVFKEALPYLLGPSVLSKIRLITSDEDRQCLEAFEEVRELLYSKLSRRFENSYTQML
jgi:hypothetical protein